jgi:hypothetical protein
VDILENNSLAHNNFLPGHPGKIEACLAWWRSRLRVPMWKACGGKMLSVTCLSFDWSVSSHTSYTFSLERNLHVCTPGHGSIWVKMWNKKIDKNQARDSHKLLLSIFSNTNSVLSIYTDRYVMWIQLLSQKFWRKS